MTTDRSEVRVTACPTWDHFIRELRVGVGRLFFPRAYRGHGQLGWPLSSVFERWLCRHKGGDSQRLVDDVFEGGREGRRAFETLELQRFKALAQALPGVELPGLADTAAWLCLGRQHGLVTPLLDWSLSPFVAAFFAFTSAAGSANPGFEQGNLQMILHPDAGGGFTFPSGPVAVWALSMSDDIEVPGEFELLANPPLRSSRLHAQKGLYTYLCHRMHVDLAAYLASRGLAHYLERFEIPGQEVGNALSDLERMGITYAALFPDLDGVARQANMGRLWEKLGWFPGASDAANARGFLGARDATTSEQP